MMRSKSRARSALGLTLCLLTLASSVAVPLLDRGGFFSTPTAESEHDLSRCAPRHDHRVCTQISANLAVASETHEHHVAHVFVASALPAGPGATVAKPLLEGPPSRAPPLA